MDRKSLVAILLCVIFYIGYEYFLSQKYPDRFNPQKKPSVTESASTGSAVNPSAAVAPGMTLSSEEASESEPLQEELLRLSAEDLTLGNDVATYRFINSGEIQSIVLKDYASEDGKSALELLSGPLLIQGHSSLEAAPQASQFQAVRKDSTLEFSRRQGAWLITQSFEIPQQGHGVSVKVSWKNVSSAPVDLQSAVLMRETVSYAAKNGGFLPGMPSGRPAILYNVAHKSSWQDLQEYCEKDNDVLAESSQELDFIGFDRHYFLQLLLPSSKKTSFKIDRQAASNQSCEVKQWLWLQQGLVPAGAQISETYKAWFGPKAVDLMEPYDIRLAESLDLGIFSVISRPLFVGLNYLHSFMGNWGLAIIALTLLLKLLLYPLARQAAIAQNRMKKLQPEMNRIKEKFKDDTRQQQQEIMRFMAANKVNPMKGCLPVLPQIPVFYAFYRVLSTSIELRHAPFFGWIHDLSVADPYYITPLILGVTMFVQQKMMPTTGLDKAQERIMMMLPLVFTVMMLTLPAGMVLYMLTNTVVSIGQQQWLNKKLT